MAWADTRNRSSRDWRTCPVRQLVNTAPITTSATRIPAKQITKGFQKRRDDHIGVLLLLYVLQNKAGPTPHRSTRSPADSYYACTCDLTSTFKTPTPQKRSPL